MGEVRSARPKPIEFHAIEMVEMVIGGVRIERPNNSYKQRAWRWANAKQSSNKILSGVIEVEKICNFKAYTYAPRGISNAKLFYDKSRVVSLASREETHVKALILLRIVAPGLPPLSLESK